MPNFNPLAPLGTWDIEVELAGKIWTIPAAPASEWLIPIVNNSPEDLLTMLAGDTEALEDALYFGEVTWAELETAFHDVVEEVAGVRWWEAQRLLTAALNWDNLGGELLLRGIRLEETSVAQACVVVWRLLTRGADDQEKNKIIHEIEKPPPGVAYEEAIDDEANMAAFGSIPSD